MYLARGSVVANRPASPVWRHPPRRYENAQKTPFQRIQDTSAFATCL
jgi:hypothetical protein